MLTRILLDPQGGEGNGNNANGDTKADISTMATGLLQKQGGDSIKVISKLLKENHQYREQIRDTKAKVPVDGSVVLTGDDAKRYKSFLDLGDDPKAIKQRLEAGDAAIVERDGMVRERAYPKAASLGGYNEKLFAAFAKRDKLNVAFETVKDKNGKDAEAAFVLDAEGKKTPLSDFVNAHWSDIKDSLGGQETGEPARKSGMPGRANDNTPAPRPGSDATPDARAAYLKTIGRSGL